MGGLGPKNKHGERGLSCACEKERSARRVPSSREGPLGMKCFTRGFAAEAQPLTNRTCRGLCWTDLRPGGASLRSPS